MKEYNTTQLNPETAFEKHVFHRDQFAHYLRWSHVLNLAKIGQKIMDFGCGSGNLYEVFYRNRYQPNKFLGLDVRQKTIEKNREKFKNARWETEDLAKFTTDYGKDWDIITSFEVLEHVNKKNGDSFMQNIKRHCNENTVVLISTPCYNEKVGAADNHIYDGQVQEYTYDEAKALFEKYFTVEKVWGTFASQRDYKPFLSDAGKKLYEKLSEYYDTNLISVIFAPLFPQQSRNCLWQLKIKI